MSWPPPTPFRARLLSNGRYTVMLNESGAGSSRWRELAVTRWREDPTSDGWGSFVLLRDFASGAVWSVGRQPCGGEPDAYDATFSDGRAEIARRDGTLATILEVAVDSDHDAELRRVTIRNHGDTAREIELTSYAELVLGSAAADAAHPAFSKMFVQTEVHEELLLATRRRRTPEEPEVWAAHLVVSDTPSGTELELETDRARFLGRGRSLRDAAALRGLRLLPRLALARIVPAESCALVIVRVEREDALEDLDGVLGTTEAPETQRVSVQAAQERPVVEAAPRKHAIESIGQRQLADPYADLVVNERPLRRSIEQLVSEVGMSVQAAQITKQRVHEQLARAVEVASR